MFSDCLESSKTHAKTGENCRNSDLGYLTGDYWTATITKGEPQQRTEFIHTPSCGPWTEHRRRDSHLIPAGEGDLHRRVSLHCPPSTADSAWESVHRISPSFPRRIGGDVSTVQEKKRKYRHQQ